MYAFYPGQNEQRRHALGAQSFAAEDDREGSQARKFVCQYSKSNLLTLPLYNLAD